MSNKKLKQYIIERLQSSVGRYSDMVTFPSRKLSFEEDYDEMRKAGVLSNKMSKLLLMDMAETIYEIDDIVIDDEDLSDSMKEKLVTLNSELKSLLRQVEDEASKGKI